MFIGWSEKRAEMGSIDNTALARAKLKVNNRRLSQ